MSYKEWLLKKNKSQMYHIMLRSLNFMKLYKSSNSDYCLIMACKESGYKGV